MTPKKKDKQGKKYTKHGTRFFVKYLVILWCNKKSYQKKRYDPCLWL